MLQASLKVIGGKNDGKLIEFRTKKFLVGREQDCHLRPNSDLVSRHHCVFTLDDYTLRLRDLGSTNGTLVNGRQIRGETVLTPGDVVKIGKLNLEVVIGDPAEATSAPPRPAANQETTTNATAVDTAHEMPQQTTLEDSGMIATSGSDDTTQFEVPIDPVEPNEEVAAESDTSVTESATQETVDPSTAVPSQPVQPPPGDAAPQQPGYPPPDQQFPQGGWQYPQYGQQYPQYYAGYPMGYPPPGYPPGYGYPQQPGPYPNYPQPGMPQSPPADQGSSAENQIPEVRLPNPEETGYKAEPPKPASDEAPQSQSKESTPSERAAELINSSRRRRRSEE